MRKMVIAIICWFIVTNASAVSCFLTMLKDNCWQDYDVTVNAVDTKTHQTVTQIVIPKGKSWARQAFVCSASQIFEFQATFSPVIWADQKDRVYSSQRYWQLPAALSKGTAAWNIVMCYGQDFANLPLPPTATSHCACDASQVPAIPPQ